MTDFQEFDAELEDWNALRATTSFTGLLVSQQAWPLALLCTLLALATMLCVLLIPRAQLNEKSLA